LEILELELKDLLQKSEPNRSAIDSKITAMGDLRTKMKKDHVHAYLDARSVLTKEQMEKCMHGSCDCGGVGTRKVVEHESCSPQGMCPNKGR
jgi:Spy/CpxP family protein refolding chaperone